MKFTFYLKNFFCTRFKIHTSMLTSVALSCVSLPELESLSFSTEEACCFELNRFPALDLLITDSVLVPFKFFKISVLAMIFSVSSNSKSSFSAEFLHTLVLLIWTPPKEAPELDLVLFLPSTPSIFSHKYSTIPILLSLFFASCSLSLLFCWISDFKALFRKIKSSF